MASGSDTKLLNCLHPRLSGQYWIWSMLVPV